MNYQHKYEVNIEQIKKFLHNPDENFIFIYLGLKAIFNYVYNTFSPVYDFTAKQEIFHGRISAMRTTYTNELLKLTKADLKKGNLRLACCRIITFIACKYKYPEGTDPVYFLFDYPYIYRCIKENTDTNVDLINRLIFDTVISILDFKTAVEMIKVDPYLVDSSSISALIKLSMEKQYQPGVYYCFNYLKKYEPASPYIDEAEVFLIKNQNIENLSNNGIDWNQINTLSGKEFEDYIINEFKKHGYETLSTKSTGDYGADIIVTTQNGSRIAIQCKRFRSKVNLKAVQEVLGAIGHYACDYGIVITNNSFLNSAIKLAESHDIELWDGDCLLRFLNNDLTFSELPAL